MDREARWVESVPLVDEKGHSPSSVDGEEDQIPQRRPQPWFRRNWKTVALNSVTTTLSLIALVFYFQEHDRRCNINRPHSQIYSESSALSLCCIGFRSTHAESNQTAPAKDYLRYQTIQMDTSGRHLNKYMNVHRTPEVDEAWHELMECK